MKRKKKSPEQRKKEIDETYTMNIFFLSIWNKRKRISEVDGSRLGQEPLTIFFHHILPKKKYPEAKYDEENIILLTWTQHDQVEADMYYYELINKKREQLKIKYNL